MSLKWATWLYLLQVADSTALVYKLSTRPHRFAYDDWEDRWTRWTIRHEHIAESKLVKHLKCDQSLLVLWFRLDGNEWFCFDQDVIDNYRNFPPFLPRLSRNPWGIFPPENAYNELSIVIFVVYTPRGSSWRMGSFVARGRSFYILKIAGSLTRHFGNWQYSLLGKAWRTECKIFLYFSVPPELNAHFSSGWEQGTSLVNPRYHINPLAGELLSHIHSV